MSAGRVSTALVVVAILLCLATLAPAQNSRARIVRLSYIDGDARIDQGSAQGEQRAILNMPVIQGTRLMADEDGRIEVEFENGSTMRLVGPAEVIFRELSLRNDGNKISLIEVTHGLVYFDVVRKGDDDFRVTVQNHNVEVHKTSHFRVDDTAGAARIAVMKGQLDLLDAPDGVEVKKGDTITFDRGDAAHYVLAKDIDPIGPDQWDHDRAQDRETYARSQAYKNTLTYAGSPYSYGMYDLASYGSWFSGPGGPCWRPSGYGFGWDPFSQGAWNYYPGNGWVFVSYYPWGWTPYRYGSWNWFGGTGWCWNPGGYYGWNPYPVIVTQPPQYNRPTPPGKPPGPPVYIGGRKVLPNGNPDPDSFRKPAPGFDKDAPAPPAKGALPPVVGTPGVPTGVKAPVAVPSGRPWGGGERPGRGNRTVDVSNPNVSNPNVRPGNPTPNPNSGPRTDTPRSTPTAPPHVDTPRTPAPAPQMNSTPHYSPPPPPPAAAPAPAPSMPAPSPHVESAKPH